MKPFILMMLLLSNIVSESIAKSNAIHFLTPSIENKSHHCCFFFTAQYYYSLKDYGVYFKVEKKGDSVIVIKAWYLIKTGDKHAKKAMKTATRFWNDLSGMFMLKPFRSENRQLLYRIDFDLKYFERDDPELERKQLDTIRSNDRSLMCQSNCFYVVNDIINEGQICSVENPGRALGVTCKNYQTRVRRTEIRSENVVAHEIGHTLGLQDRKDKEGLMKEDNSGGLWVCRSDIKEIIHFVFRNIFDLHGFIDPAIPEGEIIRKEGNDEECNGCTTDTEFRYER